jgi:hypothetical protein
MFEIFGVDAMSARNEMSGLQGGVHQDMTMPNEKDNALCSPTSALETK